MRAGRQASILLGRVGGVRRWILLCAVLGAVTVAAGIGLVALSTHLVTMSEIYGTAATMSLVILGVRATAVTRVVARYVDRYVGHLATFRVLTRLRVWSYRALLVAEPLGDDRHPRGEIVTALVDDVETMQDHVLRVAVPPLVAVIALIVAAWALAAIEPALAIVTAVLGAAIAVPAALALRRMARSAGGAITELRAERMARCTEEIDALEELVAWGRADRLTDSLAAIDRRERPFERRTAAVRSRSEAIVALGSGLVVVLVAGLALRQPVTDPTWVAAAPVIVLALSEVLGPLLAGAERSASTDAAAGRVLAVVDDHRPPVRPAPVPVDDIGATPTIRLDRVSFSFDDDTLVLRDASAVIPWGTTVVVIAPSGTGKSTLASLLLGLRSPDSGTIEVDGVDVRSIDHEGGPTLLAAVLQDDHLFDTTLRDDLLVADGSATDADLQRVLRVVGLDELVTERSLDLAVGEDGANLSGGERRRVLLARAVLADAPVLVLDEPGEHLDRDRRREVLTTILERRQGRTTIVLAHDADALAAADLVLEMRDGRLVPRHA